MKLITNRITRGVALTAIAGGMAFLSLGDSAEAAVVWEFQQVGSDVVATASGTLSTNPGDWIQETFVAIEGPFVADVGGNLWAVENTPPLDPGFGFPLVARNNNGASGLVPFFSAPSSGTGKFGLAGGGIVVGIDNWNSFTGVVIADASLTWEDQTLEGVLGPVNSGIGFTAPLWIASGNSNERVTVAVVPEPSGTALFGIAAFLGLAVRRRRR